MTTQRGIGVNPVPNPGFRDALNRFALATAGPVLALVTLWLVWHNPKTEAADRVYFLSALLIGFGALFVKVPARLNLGVAVLGFSALGVMAWGLKTVEHTKLLNEYWLGFRLRVALSAFALIPFADLLLRKQLHESRWVRALLWTLLGGVSLLGALSFIQTRTSLGLASHSAYILNEIYAVAAGNEPYTNFVPQYQTLFSYLFAPLIAMLGAERALNPVLYVLSVFSIVTVGLGVFAGLRATMGLNRMLAPLLILPLVFLTQGPGRSTFAGSISALLSAFPVRMVLPTLVGVVLSFLPVLFAQRWSATRHTLPLGALLGLGCFHQLDFGLAAGFGVGVVMLVGARWRFIARELVTLAAGVCGGFMLVPLLHWLCGDPLRMGTVGWFVRQFGGGFGSEPIQIPGPVLVVLPLVIAATVTCLGALKALRQASGAALAAADSGAVTESAASMASPAYLAALVGSYFGVFAIAAFPYYLNRSYASGQLQIVLMPLGIALAATAQVIALSPQWEQERRSARSLLFRLALAIPVASLLLLPSPAHEWARLHSDKPETQWPSQRTNSLIALKQSWKQLGDYETVGYFGNDGNYVEATTGLHNVTRFSSPLDATMSAAALKELCAGLESPSLRVLILGESALNPTLCEKSWTVKKTRSGVLLAVRPSGSN
jgi:hypothetical protein